VLLRDVIALKQILRERVRVIEVRKRLVHRPCEV